MIADRNTVIKEQPSDTGHTAIIKKDPDDGVERKTVIHRDD